MLSGVCHAPVMLSQKSERERQKAHMHALSDAQKAVPDEVLFIKFDLVKMKT